MHTPGCRPHTERAIEEDPRMSSRYSVAKERRNVEAARKRLAGSGAEREPETRRVRFEEYAAPGGAVSGTSRIPQGATNAGPQRGVKRRAIAPAEPPYTL